MKHVQSSKLDRQKFLSDPILMCTILLLFAFLILFILYPLAVLLVDSIYVPEDGGLTLSVFQRILNMFRFRTAFANTLKLGLLTGLFSTIIGLLFAYVDVYMRVRSRELEKLLTLFLFFRWFPRLSCFLCQR